MGIVGVVRAWSILTMPVMPRTFITCKVASLSKSVECGSLSLYWGEEGRASSVPCES